MMMCPIHGFVPTCTYSPDLLEFQQDGILPEIIEIEIKNSPEEEAFFRFIVSPKEASKLHIIDGRIPFNLDAATILDNLPEMCGLCFAERRKELINGSNRPIQQR